MDLNIFNSDLEQVGIVDTYKSLLWNRKYFTSGDFEIYAPATEANLSLLKKYNLVFRDDASEVGYINSINIKQGDDGTFITASGKFLSGILEQRIILEENGTLSGLISLNCIDTVPDRIINGLELGDCEEITYTNTNFKGEKILEALEALAKSNNIGFKIALNPLTKKLVFETFRGQDRSIEQTVNPQVIFSQEYDNLLSSEYSISDTGTVNTVYGVCKGLEGVEYTQIPTVTISNGTGLGRFEAYVETEAVTFDWEQTITVSHGETSETATINHTSLDYNKTLANMQADCNAALCEISENFEGETSFQSGYKESCDLGDVVTVFNDEWGLSISSRIFEVQEVYDESGTKIIPVFGSPLKTIMDILK